MKKQTTTYVKIIEVFGWYGIVAILAAYFLTMLNILEPTHLLVLFLNISGAFCMLLDAWKDRNYQPVFGNIVWILVGIYSLVTTYLL